MADAIDHEHMAHALRLAANGLYDTAPNPAVGCVLVHDGARRRHGLDGAGGRAARRESSRSKAAGAAARGATAYVTLEPCCHTGRTGPCTQSIARSRRRARRVRGPRSESARRTAAVRGARGCGSRRRRRRHGARGRAAESRFLHAHAARCAVRAQQARREPRRPHGARQRRRANGSRAPPRAPTCIAGARARAPC